jgi:hypothetical protein
MSTNPSHAHVGRARQLAAYRRVRRAELRRQIKAGEIDVYRVISGGADEFEDVVSVTKLETLLKMLPGVGEETLEQLIDAIRLRRYTRMNALTYERRAQIAEVVKGVLEVPDPMVPPPALGPLPPLP